MNKPPESWLGGDMYEKFMGRWSRRLAKEFIDWLTPPASWNWLDVGCGTGALTQTICQYAHPASVLACDPSPQFVSFARGSLAHPAVTFEVAGAEELPRREGGFDAVVSGLVLNFIPDQPKAVRALGDRLCPGGMLAAYVWDYAEGMQFVKIFWEEAAELDRRAADLDEGLRFPICRPGALARLLEGEGLDRVDSAALEIDTTFSNFDDYWVPFLGGTGTGPAYVSTLDPTAQERLKLRLRQRLAPNADGPIQLKARAWAARGFR